MSSEFPPVYSRRFEVEVGGNTYREPGGRIAELTVETTIDGADRVSFTLNYPFDPEHGDFSGMEWEDFGTGTNVDVSMGWGGTGSLEPLFLGKIHSIRTDFSPDTGPSVEVSGYGKLHEMMGGTSSRSWADAAIGDVVEEVLSAYFGERVVNDAGLKQAKVIQHDQSDYRFLRELADKYGYHFYAKRNTIFFTPRTSVGSDDPVATLRYGEVVDSFSAEINTSNEVRTVEVRYWDMETEQEIVGAASTDANTTKKTVFRIPCRSSDEAERIAETKLNTLSRSVTDARGEAEGTPAIVAGETIRLAELGERFSKNYYVTEAIHRIGGSGYRTSFEVTEVPE